MILKTPSVSMALLLVISLVSCKSTPSASLQSATDCPVANDFANVELNPNDPLKNGTQPFREVPMTAELAAKVFEMVQSSYQAVGGGSAYKNSEDLRRAADLALIAEKNGKVILFAAANKGRHGRKVNIVATDGTADGTAAARILIKSLAEGDMPGTYAEVSGAPLLIASMVRDKLKIVPFEKAKAILNPPHVIKKPNEIELTHAVSCREIPDKPVFRQNAYIREIKNVGIHTKVMIGLPTN